MEQYRIKEIILSFSVEKTGLVKKYFDSVPARSATMRDYDG